MNSPAPLEVKLIATTSLVRAALAGRSCWLHQQDRTSARNVFESNRTASFTWSMAESAEVASKIGITAAALDSLLTQIQDFCLAFGEVFDEQCIGVKYGDPEIDAACQSLPAGLCRELERLIAVNSVIPAPHLEILYERAKHLAVHQK